MYFRERQQFSQYIKCVIYNIGHVTASPRRGPFQFTGSVFRVKHQKTYKIFIYVSINTVSHRKFTIK